MKHYMYISIFALSIVSILGYATESANAPHATKQERESRHEHHSAEENDHRQSRKEVASPTAKVSSNPEGAHGAQATRIDDALAQQAGIATSVASSQTLNLTTVVYGSLATGPEQLSHVRARYPGMIKSVKPTVGDEVERGQLLAEVESNESLKTYQVRSPISGVVIQYHANSGEVAQDQVLFYIANFETLWAEFRIYPAQQSQVKAGQTAHIVANDEELTGTIRHIIPALDKPYLLARVSFDNRVKRLTPGLLVEGHVIIDKFTASVAVEKAAIQTVGNQPGVFVKDKNEYEFVPVTIGRQDDRYVEVLSGLIPGHVYVNKNSYLIKADIEKSEAEHEH